MHLSSGGFDRYEIDYVPEASFGIHRHRRLSRLAEGCRDGSIEVIETFLHRIGTPMICSSLNRFFFSFWVLVIAIRAVVRMAVVIVLECAA